jgi:nanoRNase/pAp phosphatase (c-di-AMP/oligoRNAs hydrolase)
MTIDKILDTVKFNNYDVVYITDITPSPDNIAYQLNYDKIILIDHHDTAIEMNDPEYGKVVNSDHCSSYILKEHMKKWYDVDLSYLDNFITLVEDYDLWTEVNPRSKYLARLFHHYKPIQFKKRFFEGVVDFDKDELKVINDDKKKLQVELDATNHSFNCQDYTHVNGILLRLNNFSNEICNIKLTKGYNIVFSSNSFNNVSIRSKLDCIHIGKVLKERGIGGGHQHAAGFSAKSYIDVRETVRSIASELYDNFPEIRKKHSQL